MISLAVARSLSQAGIDVYALGDRTDPLRHSRHRREFVPVESGTAMQAQMLDWLADGPGEGVVLPCSDEGVELIGRHRARLVSLGYAVTEANDEAMLDMLDKERTYGRALRAGVPAPWVGTVRSLEEARTAGERVGYPCALKPRHSHRFAHHFTNTKKAFVARDPVELERALEQTVPLGLEMMIAEIVPGPDDFPSCYSFLDERGVPLFAVTKRKLRQLPPKFGPGTYHLTEWNPEVAELGLRFFRGAGLRGLVNVEFKRDSRDGELKLIECNHRFTATTELLRRCGADLPLFVYNRAVGLAAPDPSSYRRGVGFWYPLRDARSFLQYRRIGELGLRDWVGSLLHPQRFPLASFEDPLPSLAALGRRGRRRLGRQGPAAQAREVGQDRPAGNRSTTSRRASSSSASREVPSEPAEASPSSARTSR